MAQSNNKNGSSNGAEPPMDDVELILGSIIGHIQDRETQEVPRTNLLDAHADHVAPESDQKEQADILQAQLLSGQDNSADMQNACEAQISPAVEPGLASPELAAGKSNSPKSDSKVNVREIEQRANDLASRLGSAGLSFGAGTSPLAMALGGASEAPASREQPVPNTQGEPEIPAIIHVEDRHMEEAQRDVSPIEAHPANSEIENNQPEVEPVGARLEQEQLVHEWEADADADGGNIPHVKDDQPEQVEEPEPVNELAEPVLSSSQHSWKMPKANQYLDAFEQVSPASPAGMSGEVTRADEAGLADDQTACDDQSVCQASLARIDAGLQDNTDSAPAQTITAPTLSNQGEQKKIAAGMQVIAASMGAAMQDADKTDDENIVDPDSLHPDLGKVEQQIEKLSQSMKAAEDQHQASSKLAAKDSLANEPEADCVPDLGKKSNMDIKVGALEKQVVSLLDKIAVSEQNMGEVIAENVRVQTKEAVRDAIASSEHVVSLKLEIEAIGEERRVQDAHMTDSLDALHDALKDISERMSDLETAPVGKTGKIALAGAGASLVAAAVVAKMNDDSAEMANEHEHEARQSDRAGQEEQVISAGDKEPLPTWLEDATQDLHGEQTGAQEELQDVFASPSGEAEKPALEEKAATALDPVAETKVSPVQNEAASQAEPDTMDVSSTSFQLAQEEEGAQGEWENVYEPKSPPQEEQHDEGHNFLHAARAAALAANERARVADQDHDAAPARSAGQRIVASVGRKQENISLQASRQPSVYRKPARKSLFSEKAERPNMLLVLTTLILFGTSALLLYGMSKNGKVEGNTSTLSAVEKDGSDLKKSPKKKAASPKSKSKKRAIGKQSGGKQSGGKQSRLNIERKSGLGDKSKQVAAVSQKSGADSDTLTDYDRLVAARMASVTPVPSAIDITGSIPERTDKKKDKTLFDDYVGFSGSKGQKTATKASKQIQLAGHDALPAAIGSSMLRQLASGGDARSQYLIARRFGKGSAVPANPALSLEWYQKAAASGYAPAIYRVATAYERGKGVKKNYDKALENYTRAAALGNIKAMHNLAVLYTSGNLGKSDYKTAVKWYARAAGYGIKDSQFNLAIIYQNGMGVKADMEKAFKYYLLAAKAGDNEARDLARDLREDLPLARQRFIESEVGRWTAQKPDIKANAGKEVSRS